MLKSDVPPASIRGSLDLLQSIRDQGIGQVIVAFSGGKDSFATLELTHEIFGKGNVHAYNLYIVPGLESELRELRKAERRYGIVVHRLPHPGMAASLRCGHLQPTATGFRRELKHSDIYAYIRDITAADWIIFGHRINESLQRRGMMKSSCGIQQKHRKCWPIWNWKKSDVYHFIRSRKIPKIEQWTEDDTTGFTLGPHTLLYLRKKYPGDYDKVLSAFPLAEVQILREQQRIAAGLPPTHRAITGFKTRPGTGLMEELNRYDYFSGEDGSDEAGEEIEAEGRAEGEWNGE